MENNAITLYRWWRASLFPRNRLINVSVRKPAKPSNNHSAKHNYIFLIFYTSNCRNVNSNPPVKLTIIWLLCSNVYSKPLSCKGISKFYSSVNCLVDVLKNAVAWERITEGIEKLYKHKVKSMKSQWNRIKLYGLAMYTKTVTPSVQTSKELSFLHHASLN